ncbi:MAG: serine/threonine-protein kinase [Myxococcota bacterium]|nr:serine/threonine-protein kinase [Myxococcota bacterium]
MGDLSKLETALGAELLRAGLVPGRPSPSIGRYRVESFLGRGASGLVVAARDERLDRAVALKLSYTDASGGGALSEARALARLEHPNIVRVFDVDDVHVRLDGVAFRLRVLAMQRVGGGTLRAWVRERRRTPADIVEMFLQAGAGLAAAHACKIVHRDFKPDNVLIGEDGVPQVIDFGFAIPALSSRSSAAAPVAEVAGTDAYLAPEAREGRATAKSDQFAFAIALIEALTGAAAPPPRDPPPGVEERLWAVLRRASHPKAKRRYRDMNALLSALRATQPRGAGLGCVAVALVALGIFAWPHARAAYANHRCAPISGEWGFETVVERSSGAIPVGTRGQYTATLTHRSDCEFDVSLVHTGDTGPRGEHHYRRVARTDEPIAASFGLGGPVRLAVQLEDGRGYVLRFHSARRMSGQFTAPRYEGIIAPVSRFGAPAGHDARRR